MARKAMKFMKKRKNEEVVEEVADKEVVVLCSVCGSKIGKAKLGDLKYPLRGSMMKPVASFTSWPSGPVTLDVYCPICLLFPFEYRPASIPGVIGRDIIILDNGNKVVYNLEEN